MYRRLLIVILAFLFLGGIATAATLTLDLAPGDSGVVNCDGEISLAAQSETQIVADCNALPTATHTPTATATPTETPVPTETPTPGPVSGELLTNWQLFNALDGSELECDLELLQSAPFWDAEYFGFRGPWNEDPEPDKCVGRTMGEAYPDNSAQENHIPPGQTGTLWQVVEMPGAYSAIELESVYAQHESGDIHWSLWDCPAADSQVGDCTLIYRTAPTMRIPFLVTKACSAYRMTLALGTDGVIEWNAVKEVASCPGGPIAPIADSAASFAAPAYVGVRHEITPRSDGVGMSGVKIALISLGAQ